SRCPTAGGKVSRSRIAHVATQHLRPAQVNGVSPGVVRGISLMSGHQRGAYVRPVIEKTASRQSDSPLPTSQSRPPSIGTGLALGLVWMFGFGVVGAIVGAIVGRLTERPDEFLADLDPVVGAMIGFPIGGVVGLLLFAVWALSRRPGPQPPDAARLP